MSAGKPIYTPKQLMKEGQNAGGGEFMMLMLNVLNKPPQFDQIRGGNNRADAPIQYVEQVVQNEDGSTRTIQKPVQSAVQDPDLYLNNKENFNKFELVEYQGPYHSYPNGAVYTGAKFTDESVPLIPFSSATEMAERIDHIIGTKKKPVDSDEAQSTTESENADQPVRSPNNSIYFKLTGTRFDLYTNPKYFYPEPTDQDYENGFINRFFAQKINDESSITEISKDDYDGANNYNGSGIDEAIYNLARIQWTIAGPIADVRKANDRVLLFANDTVPGVMSYLTDLDEFHKLAGTLNRNVEIGLYTPGREFLLPNGQEYVGHYHIHPDKGPMVGSEHTMEQHDRLTRIVETRTQQGTGGGGGMF
jgi:hypothetical protein